MNEKAYTTMEMFVEHPVSLQDVARGLQACIIPRECSKGPAWMRISVYPADNGFLIDVLVQER